MTEALDRCVEDGVKEIVVQPTHLWVAWNTPT